MNALHAFHQCNKVEINFRRKIKLIAIADWFLYVSDFLGLFLMSCKYVLFIYIKLFFDW